MVDQGGAAHGGERVGRWLIFRAGIKADKEESLSNFEGLFSFLIEYSDVFCWRLVMIESVYWKEDLLKYKNTSAKQKTH